MMQGPQAHAAGVEFPDDELDRYLLVGNLNPVVTADQVCMLQQRNVSCRRLLSC